MTTKQREQLMRELAELLLLQHYEAAERAGMVRKSENANVRT
jgi:hypothetical protein